MDNYEEFFGEFAAETKEHLNAMETDLIDLEDNEDEERVNRIFRGIHSIKGAAGFLKLDRVSTLTHIMETLLDLLRKKEIQPEKKYIDALLAAVDTLKVMSVDLTASRNINITEIYNHIRLLISNQLSPDCQKELNTLIRLFGPDGYDTGFEINELTLKKMPEEMFFYVLKYNLDETKSPVSLIKELFETGEIINGRIDASSDDLNVDLSQIALIYEVLFVTLMEPEILSSVTGLSENQVIRIVKPGFEFNMKNENKITPRLFEENFSENIRVTGEKLDKLVDLVGELVTLQANLAVEAKAIKNIGLNLISEKFDRLSGELREVILNIRMMPIGITFGRFKRLIRDVSQKQDKEVKLITEGEDTQLDKKVLERLFAPLAHIIRNSIDHGIESAQERKSAGKPVCGQIYISASQTGGDVLIQIRDDGTGFDLNKIKTKAMSAGLITEDQELLEQDILDLIFLPGFSTAKKVTDLSGRGVGMDVVKRETQSLCGQVEVQNHPGQGAVFTLKIPMTLTIIDGMLIQTGAEQFLVPLMVAEEIIRFNLQQMHKARQLQIMEFRGKIIPYLNLKELLMLTGQPVEHEFVMIVATRDGYVGIGVDRVIGINKTVIKPLSKIYKQVKIFTGATILGNGTMALILDINQIVKMMD